MIIVNPDGRIMLVNAQTGKLFGYERDELYDQPVEILLPQRYKSGHIAHRTGYFTVPRTRSMGAGLDLYGLRQRWKGIPGRNQFEPAGDRRRRSHHGRRPGHHRSQSAGGRDPAKEPGVGRQEPPGPGSESDEERIPRQYVT